MKDQHKHVEKQNNIPPLVLTKQFRNLLQPVSQMFWDTFTVYNNNDFFFFQNEQPMWQMSFT